MRLRHRALKDGDSQAISNFSLSEEELSFFYPEAVYPLTPKQLPDQRGEREASTVTLLEDQIVGYADFIKVRPNLFCKLGNLVVSPTHRRQGVATYLVNTMIKMAVERYAARFVRVACYSHNTTAYQLFHGLGFKPADMVPKTVPGGETILLVNMELACHRMRSIPSRD